MGEQSVKTSAGTGTKEVNKQPLITSKCEQLYKSIHLQAWSVQVC